MSGKYVNINRKANGYVMNNPFTSTDEDDDDDEIVIEIPMDLPEEEAERKAMTAVLKNVATLYGLGYDAWRKDNIKISWDAVGDEVE